MIRNLALWPEAASTTALQVDHLLYFLVGICGAVGLLIAVLMIYFCIRYRRRPGETGNPPRTAQPRALEWFWTLTPLVIFMFIFVWGAEVYFGAYRAPDNAAPIYVIGKQWMWKFQHPEGQREIDMLHVPVGQPVKLIFQAIRPGRYHLFCSQFCGTGHAGMTAEVVVMPAADYARWLHLNAEGSLALEGRKIFRKYRCLSCHSADADARAPVLENLFGRPVALSDGRVVTADENYIRESIFYPSAKIAAGWQNIMPTFKGEISEEEIIALIAYLQSLGRGETPRGSRVFLPRRRRPLPPSATRLPPATRNSEA